MALIKFRSIGIIFTAWLLFSAQSSLAIDNPDAPDITATFNTQSAKYETAIQNAPDQSEIDKAYAKYNEFLDHALNQNYTALSKQLKPESKQALIRSQRAWLQFRDAEAAFIADNWSTENFGSSSALSRNAYRAEIIKQRILELLDYLKNYQ